ncbi:hypothetical protein [Komagataeibacter medellinensis]|uniref:hypothetical protein n=1 Tax=Komagataeibacter medellinensis TaxID=1177712 RepID=UPI0012979FF8|nr:hypothetical protein [Komagataeibacter medellinensis]
MTSSRPSRVRQALMWASVLRRGLVVCRCRPMLLNNLANSRYQAPDLKFSAPVWDALANDLYQQKHA